MRSQQMRGAEGQAWVAPLAAVPDHGVEIAPVRVGTLGVEQGAPPSVRDVGTQPLGDDLHLRPHLHGHIERHLLRRLGL